MENFNIVYIDDAPEIGLGRYLDRQYSNPNYQIEYVEITFTPESGYENLLRDPKVQSANIIFIDSRLFENRTVTSSKFTGEEFKIILKKYYPFIEVIVITQNGADDSMDIISKYDANPDKTASEYYAELLPERINKAIDNILIYRRLARKLEINANWEAVLKEKIINSLQGIGTYDELTKTDLDHLISAFKELQEKIE